METAIKIGLGPLLLAQGLLVRRRAVRLPEPQGARVGSTGDGPQLRLLILGDSAAAGVGVEHQDEALLGRLVRALSQHYQVYWHLHARTGATSSDALRSLDTLTPATFDVVVTSLGVNDVTSDRSKAAFISDQLAMVARLKSDFGARLIIISGLPPVHRFPLLPQPLRWYLGRNAKSFDTALATAVASDSVCSYFQQPGEGALEMMASDGFHPGAPVYARWARLIAQVIISRLCAVSLTEKE